MFDHFSTLCMEGLMSQFFSDAIKIENDYSKGHLNKFVEKGIYFFLKKKHPCGVA